MKSVLEIFEDITRIPRCSHHTKKMQEYLVEMAKKYGYQSGVDEVGNVLCYKTKREICLQSHYDMVCVGKAPQIDLYKEDGWLKADESSLGADNGVGCAMMLYLMQQGYEAEYLFTNDEEVGLIGANDITHQLLAKKMINLDYEDEGEVCIGCAGGRDFYATKTIEFVPSLDGYQFYTLKTEGLNGGHSGVDIDKNIANGIVLLCQYLRSIECEIISIQGGEAINSIPKNAQAHIATKSSLPPSDHIVIEPAQKSSQIIKNCQDIVEFLGSFKQGVWRFDNGLGIPSNSVNLSIVKMDKEKLKIEIFARSMDKGGMDEITSYIGKEFTDAKFDLIYENDFASWIPTLTPFAKEVQNAMCSIYPSAKYKAIHAGLECGVLMSKYENIDAVAIGPTIKLPHTTKESLLISSVDKTLGVVQKLLDTKE
jgi:dipeptidase D